MNCKKIIFLVSLLIVLGCLFNFNFLTAKAMTTDEMIALIQKLQQQIADLQKQLAQAQGTQTVWCHNFNKNLSAGVSNEEVASLHTVLKKEGFDIFDEEKANKEFGESTASAISGFQQKYASEILTPLGLKYSTGILGKSTRAKLNKLFGCNIKATPQPFCSPISTTCEASTAKIVCPAGLDDKGCPYPCKCTPVACTQEAKVCPDGTSVSRIAPSCEFASCPDQTTNQTPIIYSIGGPTFLKVGETGTWTIKASDPEEKMLVYSVVWGDEAVGTAQLSPLQPTSYVQTASFSHSYSKSAIYNPTFTVADESGLGAKTSISVKVGEATSPLVSEQVKCLFKSSQTEQKCYGANSDYTNYSCSGKEACVVDIKGKQGDKITWKSSCGGYAYTTMDSQNEYAEFNCAIVPAPATPTTVTPVEIGVGVYRFEILNSAANCQACPADTACAPSPCLPASSFIIYNAKVSIYNEKGNFIASKDTSSGKAVFENLAYGNYVAYISAAGYQEDKTSFTVGANFATDSSLILQKTTATSVSSKSITVISPNGGEKLVKGATYPIKWNSSGVDSVYIKLRKGADTYNGPEGEVSKTISNSGIFFWTIPATLPDGSDYAIRIVDGTAVVLDDSDSLFSITAIPVTGYNVPLNQVANILEAAQAAIAQISQGVNELLKNR